MHEKQCIVWWITKKIDFCCESHHFVLLWKTGKKIKEAVCLSIFFLQHTQFFLLFHILIYQIFKFKFCCVMSCHLKMVEKSSVSASSEIDVLNFEWVSLFYVVFPFVCELQARSCKWGFYTWRHHYKSCLVWERALQVFFTCDDTVVSVFLYKKYWHSHFQRCMLCEKCLSHMRDVEFHCKLPSEGRKYCEPCAQNHLTCKQVSWQAWCMFMKYIKTN